MELLADRDTKGFRYGKLRRNYNGWKGPLKFDACYYQIFIEKPEKYEVSSRGKLLFKVA